MIVNVLLSVFLTIVQFGVDGIPLNSKWLCAKRV